MLDKLNKKDIEALTALVNDNMKERLATKDQIDNFIERTEKLERQNSRLKIMIIVTSAISLLLLVSTGLLIKRGLGQAGSIAVNLSAPNDKYVIKRTGSNEPAGPIRLDLSDREGKRLGSVGLDFERGPRIKVYDKDQKILTELSALQDGQIVIKLLNRAGEPLTPLAEKSQPALWEQNHKKNKAITEPNYPEGAKTGKAQDVRKTSEPASIGLPDEKKAGSYVAAPRGKAYHYPSCRWVKGVESDNLLRFSSIEEATKAGYRPCRLCRPLDKN